MEFRLDDLQGEEIRALLQLHLASAQQHSPPESVHALDVDGLRQPGVTFWSCWRDGALLGCCALKELDRGHGEIKSMRTAPQHERQGNGARIRGALPAEARPAGYGPLQLETGPPPAFRRDGCRAAERRARHKWTLR